MLFGEVLAVIRRYLALFGSQQPFGGPFEKRYFAIFAVTSAVWGGSGHY